MSLHDEIAAEMHAYATAETGGLDPLEYLRWQAPARSPAETAQWAKIEVERLKALAERTARKEAKRREKRAADEVFAESERARWRRANAARAERKRAATVTSEGKVV